MTLYRFCATGWYRVTWQRAASQVVVEQQRPCSFYSIVNSLHFQHGYDQKYAVYRIWAIVVDMVTVSTVLWVVTGISLWARRPHQRLLGAVCLVAGLLLFAGLVVGLCYSRLGPARGAHEKRFSEFQTYGKETRHAMHFHRRRVRADSRGNRCIYCAVVRHRVLCGSQR